MQPSPDQRPLPQRWAEAAAADPAVDSVILRLVEGCLTDNSINEAALLKALVEHAETLAATANTQATVIDGEATET